MTRDTPINEITSDRTDVAGTFRQIRETLEKAHSREDLTELYKQSVYMILMTHSSPLADKDPNLRRRRETAEKEFTRTVPMINEQAKKIGVEANYNEDWKKMATNGYETEEEDENLLEAEEEVGIVRK